jgi:nitrite reductase/ring-hydroxylating ferredoxin subunit
MTATAVGLSRDLRAGRAMRALVDGRDLVVWRSASGRLSAWDNRCPHRGMRLSFGFVRGERLACLYHGWQFGAEDGRCRFIPAHPDLEPPGTIRAVAHGAAERSGLIWVAPEEVDPDPPETGFAARPIRTLVAAADRTRLRDAFETTLFNGTAPRTISQGPVTSLSLGDRSVALALQALDEGQSAAHVLVDDRAERGDLSRLSRWCEIVRREAERPAPERSPRIGCPEVDAS